QPLTRHDAVEGDDLASFWTSTARTSKQPIEKVTELVHVAPDVDRPAKRLLGRKSMELSSRPGTSSRVVAPLRELRKRRKQDGVSCLAIEANRARRDISMNDILANASERGCNLDRARNRPVSSLGGR